MGIVNRDGEIYYDDGSVKNVAYRKYFQEILKGNRVLSDPLDSMIGGN